MKILYHCGHPGLHFQASTGYGRHMRGMVSGFERLGHEVVLDVAGGVKEEDAQAIFSSGKGKRLLKSLLPSRLWESIKDLRLLRQNEECFHRLSEKAKAENPDLIYERVSYLHDAGVRVGNDLGIPVFLEVNTPFREAKLLFEGKSWMLKRAERMEASILEKATAVFPVSSSIRDHFREKHGVFPSKMQVMPNAVEPKGLGKSERNSADLAEELGLSMQDKVIGFVGSIFPYHGVDRLIKAFLSFQEEYGNWKLLIAGDGEALGELKEMAAKPVKEGKVIFAGKIPPEQVYDHMALMDIAVMPASNWFGSPVKIFEYGAMGVPILAPDTGPVKDVLQNERTGLIHDMSQDGLKASLGILMHDSEKRQQLGKAFQQKVFEEHTWEKNAEKVLAFFKK